VNPEEYLRTKGYEPKKAPGEWVVRCPVCGDSRNLRHAHLYVNRDHGAWKCHRCGESGSYADLQKLHGDTPEPTSQAIHGRWSVFRAALDVCQDTLLDFPHVLKYLREERKLTADTIGKYRLGYMDGSFYGQMKARGFSMADMREAGLYGESSNTPLFVNRIIIPYLDRGNVVTLRGKQIGGNVLQARGVPLPMFGSDNVRTTDADVYICEGEFDTMYLDQLGYRVAGVPGADTFKDDWVTWFDSARRVFIVLDADDAGRKGAEKIKQAIGTKGRIVELPVPDTEETTDLQEYFLRDGYSTDDFVTLIDEYRGKRLFTVGDALAERDLLSTLSGLKLGWKDLDHWIHPGLLPGQVMVVLAKTGVGKTAWLTQVLHNLSEYYVYEDNDHQAMGESIPILVLSLEQTKAEIVNRMERIAHLWDPWLPPELFKRAHRNVRVNDENKVPPGDIRVLFNEFVDEVETPPKVIVLDYLGYWARTFKGGSRYEQVSDAVMELKAVAKEYGVSIIVPHQVSRGGKRGERLELDFARDSGVVEETADFAMSLWAPHSRDEDDESTASVYDRADVRLEILKSRHGGKGKETRMLWAPASLALPAAGHGRMKRLVFKEYEWIDEGLLYEDIKKRHQGGM
jgi:hypothetical protein